MAAKIAATVVLALTLGGCISAEKVLQPSVVDDSQCQARGHRPIEPAYVSCLAAFDAARNGRSCFGSCH